MTVLRSISSFWFTLALFGSLFVTAGCGHHIGDSCSSSIDCDQSGERTCDISQPGGYCTIDGCDEQSCPGESVCIRYFPRLFLTKVCTVADPSACTADEFCLPEGKCAPYVLERRYCASKCTNDGDCRDEYQCRLAGTEGALALVKTNDTVVRFCAPSPL